MAGRTDKFWWGAFIACLVPLAGLLIDVALQRLGSNPIQALHIRLGDWSLRLLWLTLAITPVQYITKWRGMADYRQLLGLYCFFYASLHVLAYVIADHDLVWKNIWIDILESAYIWFGVLAYVIIFLLGITSPKAAKKRMGKNWKKLHRFIYLSACAAIIHYLWQLKGNLAEPMLYLILLILLLGFRILVWLMNGQFSKMMIPKGRD
jgi:sulfoxide reductase heme-binding subunit YedZ